MAPIQADLPDFNAKRQVTDDPTVSINQAVNITPYDSGILDVGVFTQLLVSAVTQTANAVFRVSLTFYADAAGTITAFTFGNRVYNVGTVINRILPTSTRYCRVTASEITATGGALSVVVVPSSGPSREFVLPTTTATYVETSIAAGASALFIPLISAAGLWRIFFATRAPQWELDVQVADVAAVFENRGLFTNRTVTPPLTFDIRLEPVFTQIKVTNNWTNTAKFLAMINQVSH